MAGALTAPGIVLRKRALAVLAESRRVQCPLHVLLQRGFEWDPTELSGIGWNNEINKYKAI